MSELRYRLKKDMSRPFQNQLCRSIEVSKKATALMRGGSLFIHKKILYSLQIRVVM